MRSGSKKRIRDSSDPETEEESASDGFEQVFKESRSSSDGESEQDSEEEAAGEDEDEDEGADDDDDEQNQEQRDTDMEQLEQEYHNFRDQEQNLMGNLKRHRDEDALKGQAVKNQKAIWDKALEVRFLLQKAFLNANRLPQEPVRSSLCNSDVAVAQAYSDLVSTSRQTISCMLELEEALLEKNPAIVQDTKENSQDSLKDESSMDDLKMQKDDDWAQIHRMQCRIVPFRNNSVDRWHGKMQVTSGAAAIKNKLHAFNQKISDQVAGFMRDPSRMIKRMQLRRSSLGILGEVPRDPESKGSVSITEQDLNDDGDPEFLDDSEFYQQLLKEFFESCDLISSEMTFYALKRLQPKKRKIVDRCASKSRKIRYNVNEKIVNFMAPVPMDVPQIAPKLFDNLFGRANYKSTPVEDGTFLPTREGGSKGEPEKSLCHFCDRVMIIQI